MTHFRYALVLLVAICVQCLPSVAQPAGLARLDAHAAGFSAYVLPNGFKIILAPFPSAANARIELLIKTGSKLEGYGETGMAHLLEHMLFKSAGRRADLKSDLTALGANWNGTTNADRTNFFETVAAEPEKIDEAIRIEADRFIRASFTKEHLASEMSVVRNELERSDNDPGSLVMRALQRQSYFWHGYSRPTIGARSDIEDAPFSALQAFHRKHYRPDNAALIVSGNFDPQRVLALASRLFAHARNPSGPKISSWTREEPRATTNRSELILPAGKTMAASAWKLPGMNERQTYAFDLGISAICDEDWGSLRKDLVLERRIAVAVSCGTHMQTDYSLLIATATAGQEADAELISRALREHIESAAAGGVSQEQLERARLTELNAYERMENAHEMLASLLSQAEVSGDWRLYFWQRDMVKTVDRDEVNAALKKWAVGINRSDVLLRHGEGNTAPELPKFAAATALVSGKEWPAIAMLADPLPNSASDLAKATITIPLDGSRAKAALISRQTQGSLAWLNLNNDYGNESALSGRRTACAIADQLMAYGGAGLDRDQLSAKLEALQAQWSLGLGGIVIEAPRRNIEAALDILLGVWASPALPQSEFERLKAAAIAKLEAGLKDPAQLAASDAGLRFDNYPPGHPLQPRSLEQKLAEYRTVSFAQASACVADFSGLAQVRLAMVGAFSEQDVQAVWAKVAKLPTARIAYDRVRDIDAPLVVDTTPLKVSMPEKPNASIAGSTLLRITDDAADFPALRIAVKVLGGDADSRIWTRLREREGLAYSAGASLSGNHFEPRSKLVIQASAASDKADAALSSLKEELARALKDGFSATEVERAKRAWLHERKTSLREERSYASSLAQGMYSGRDYAWLAQYDKKIATLDAQQVTHALRKYLADAPIVWAIGRGQ
ncbi:M16 family metallopeptidase [Propionivibrio sp.]|uniref:M16 family metallopeptidase n=1 Tax=Propionivibrio sp. TaxID=2212460 RepID=UPI002609B05A|nr:M16 family metallopeptidase [Propionivibrio sp.]